MDIEVFLPEAALPLFPGCLVRRHDTVPEVIVVVGMVPQTGPVQRLHMQFKIVERLLVPGVHAPGVLHLQGVAFRPHECAHLFPPGTVKQDVVVRHLPCAGQRVQILQEDTLERQVPDPPLLEHRQQSLPLRAEHRGPPQRLLHGLQPFHRDLLRARPAGTSVAVSAVLRSAGGTCPTPLQPHHRRPREGGDAVFLCQAEDLLLSAAVEDLPRRHRPVQRAVQQMQQRAKRGVRGSRSLFRLQIPVRFRVPGRVPFLPLIRVLIHVGAPS